MPLVAKETGNGKDFDPVPEGVHIGVCYLVADLGTHHDERWNKDKHEVVIGWEIPTERIEIERDGQTVDLPRAISRRFTLSLSERANLRPILEGWRGRSFTADELAGFDLANVVGKACQLQVLHNVSQSNGKTYGNVANVMAMPKGAPAPETENAPQYYSIDEHGAAIPENLPEWIVEVIHKSHEWAELTGGNGAAAPADDAAPDFSDADDESLPF